MDIRHSTAYGDFEWDSAKNAANIKKHGISFFDACAVFQDEQGMLIFDATHSEHEERFTLIGRLKRYAIAVAVFTERGRTLRIISARLATKKEALRYAIG